MWDRKIAECGSREQNSVIPDKRRPYASRRSGTQHKTAEGTICKLKKQRRLRRHLSWVPALAAKTGSAGMTEIRTVSGTICAQATNLPGL